MDQVPSGRGTEEDFPMLLHDEHGCEITGDWKFVQLHASVGVTNGETRWIKPG